MMIDDDEGKILQLPVQKKNENVNCTSFCNNVFWWSINLCMFTSIFYWMSYTSDQYLAINEIACVDFL